MRNSGVKDKVGVYGALSDELARAAKQALGVPLPHGQTGDKRRLALRQTVLRTPSERATLLAHWRPTSVPARAP